jgi:apolipoprotein N-acyltransferase
VASLSPPLLASAQSPISLGPLALVALVPWLWATRRAGRVEAIGLGALVGTAYGCLATPWLPGAMRSLGSSGSATAIGLLATAAWAKLPLFAGVGWLARRLRSRPPHEQIAGVALAFALGEWWIGSWSLGLPLALLGHSQLSTLGVAQLAVVAGVPLLSGGVAALNLAIALSLAGAGPARPLAAALAGAWIAMALLGLPIARAIRPAPLSQAETALLLVQPNLPPLDRWVPEMQRENLQRVAAYTDRALARDGRDVQAIVWPENLLTSPVDTVPGLSTELRRWVGRWRIPVISGLVRPAHRVAPRRYRSSVVWIDPARGVSHAIDKVRAVPLLESSRALPGAATLALLFGRAARWPKVEEAPSAGPLRGDFTVSPVLCYEVLFPRLVARRRSPESLAILNLAADGWVGEGTATRQVTDLAAFRAIEQRLTLIRVAHGGLSSVVDEYGDSQLELPPDRWAHAVVSVRPSPPPSALERASLLGLPLAVGLGVWWAHAGWARRPARGAKESKERPS